MLKKSRKKFSC